MADIITPSCLNVESAIIFFISHSFIATNPAISMVVLAMIRIITLKDGSVWRNG